MARIARTYLFALATEPAATLAAKADLAAAKGSRLNDREASHVAALALLLAGEWSAAGLALDRHNLRSPHVLLALQAGHLLDFYRANERLALKPHSPINQGFLQRATAPAVAESQIKYRGIQREAPRSLPPRPRSYARSIGPLRRPNPSGAQRRGAGHD